MKTKDFRRQIADRFIKSLQENPKTWRKEWFSKRPPFNGAKGNEYKGINRLWLSHLMETNGWDDPRFMTFNQAKNKDAHVKKGEKGTHVEFWSPYDKKNKKKVTWGEFHNLEEEDRGMISSYYTVFNGSQIEGLEPYKDGRETNAKPNEAVQKMADSMGVKVVHGGNRAFYRAYSPLLLPPY